MNNPPGFEKITTDGSFMW